MNSVDEQILLIQHEFDILREAAARLYYEHGVRVEKRAQSVGNRVITAGMPAHIEPQRS